MEAIETPIIITGRPTDYKQEYDSDAVKLCQLGATDKQIADFFEVSEVTLNAWKQKHPRFLKSLRAGKLLADANVGNSLYQRALGYSHKAVKVFCQDGQTIEHEYVEHYPPDTVACIFWLKNRRPDLWRDNQAQVNIGVNVIAGATDEILAALKQLAVRDASQVIDVKQITDTGSK